MLRKDIIQRQFEEFGKMMALLLGFKRNNDWEKFRKEIEEAAKKFTSLDIDAVENLTDDDFNSQVINHNSTIQDQKKILAELLYEKMNYYAQADDRERYMNLKNKSLNLYKHLRDNFTENEFDLNVHYKIEFLSKIED